MEEEESKVKRQDYLLWALESWQEDFKRTGKMVFLRGISMKPKKKYMSVRVTVKRES